jgi:peptidoglycan/LPS O-acetylase OafA/YrhL
MTSGRGGGMANRLAALTSLRFLAAAAIVYHHVMGAWAFPRVPEFLFAQGVSFFFVLSGFILTYRYPLLRDWPEIRRFWLARFARIWPAHATSLVIVVATATAVLSSFDGTNLRFYVTTNLLMVQSWIPSRAAISLNGPSWSISTEFAFYLMFPLLISDFARTWHVKLVGAIVLSFLIVVACFVLGIDWGNGAFPVIVGFPLTRLFEFVLGMCAALLWRRLPAIRIGRVYGTALELAALGLVVLASHLAVRVPNPGSAPSAWLAICALPSVPAALLIVAMAMNRGLISRALSFPAAVFLGEISYSVYLLHGLIAYVVAFRLPQMSPAQMSATYIATLLAVAAATWYFVERPARIALTSGAWIRRRSPEIVPEIP